MLCLGGSLLFAVVTVLQEIVLKTHSCAEYLALLGFFGSVVSCTQTFFLEFNELYRYNWYELDSLVQLGSFCSVQTVFQILTSLMLRDAGSIILHLSFLSSDYYTLIAGMYIFQFKVSTKNFCCIIFDINSKYVYIYTNWGIFEKLREYTKKRLQKNWHIKLVLNVFD